MSDMAETGKEYVGGIKGRAMNVRSEADINLDISQSLQGEVSRFKNI